MVVPLSPETLVGLLESECAAIDFADGKEFRALQPCAARKSTVVKAPTIVDGH